MKRLFLLITIITAFFVASSAFAVTVKWKYTPHSSNPSVLQSQVQNLANQGWTPLGLSYKDGKAWMLYVGGGLIKISAWSLNWYSDKDVNALKNGISSKMKQGYYPTGVSYIGDRIYILFIKRRNTGTAWQLVRSSQNLQALRAKIQPYEYQSYIPVGITSNKGYFYALMVKTPGTTSKGWTIDPYSASDSVVKAGINSRITQGYVPWGFMYRHGRVYILYTKFQ